MEIARNRRYFHLLDWLDKNRNQYLQGVLEGFEVGGGSMNAREKFKIAQRLKEEYPKGTRVELISMDDPYTDIPKGTKGTVVNVDDMATIHVNWDTGSSLGVAYGEDKIKKI